MRNILLIFTLIFFFITQSNAQIVNIESQRLKQDTTGIKGLISSDFYSKKTTSDLLSLNIGSKIQYKNKKSTVLLITSAAMYLKDKENIENNGFFHLRYNYGFSKKLEGEVFNQYQYDPVLKIQSRYLAGFGPKFNFVDKDILHLSVGVAYMYEYEQELNNNIFHRDHRMSSYVSLFLNLGKKAELGSISYFQPNLNNFSDMRLSTGSSLNILLLKNLKWNMSLSLTYDSEPVIDPKITELSYKFSNGLTYSF